MSAQKKKVVNPEYMRIWLSVPAVGFLVIFLVISFSYYFFIRHSVVFQPSPTNVVDEAEIDAQLISPIPLPLPLNDSKMSLEKALKSRRSQRSFTPDPLSMKQVSQLLWAAQGVTSDWGGRTAPSAKSTYPLTVYLLSYNITDLDPGVYRYIPGDREPVHQLILHKPGNLKTDLANLVGQNSLSKPAAVMIISGNFLKMNAAFDGHESDKEVYLEAGHASQNVYLEVESLSLGTVALTTDESDRIVDLLDLPSAETVIYLMPIGVPKT